MPLVVKDRVKETTTTTGTGTLTLAGAVTGFQAFSVIGDGNTTYYTITDGTNFEVGVGTYTLSGTTLSRDTILESSNSGSAVNWSAGSKDVFVTYPAERAVYTDAAGTAITPATASTLGVVSGGTGASTLTGVVKGTGTAALTAGTVNLASEVTGTLPVANGGTGAATLTANNVILGNGTSAVQFVAPGTSGNVLTSNGSTWTSAAGGGGSGDVVGPASATDNAVARFDSTTGKLIQDSAVTIADTTGDITTPGRIFVATANFAAPAIAATADTNTGISWSGVDGLRISTGGIQRIFITNGATTFTNNILLGANNYFPYSQRYVTFGTVSLFNTDTQIDTDLSFFVIASRNFNHYNIFQVLGLYDAGTGSTYAYNNKHWQQNIVWTGSAFSIAGANLIGTAYTSDATNFPAGAVNASRILTNVLTSTTYNLRLINRTSPAAGSITQYSYYAVMYFI